MKYYCIIRRSSNVRISIFPMTCYASYLVFTADHVWRVHREELMKTLSMFKSDSNYSRLDYCVL